MLRALYSSSSGMQAQQMNLDVIANNLANVNTTGFITDKGAGKSLGRIAVEFFQGVVMQGDGEVGAFGCYPNLVSASSHVL